MPGMPGGVPDGAAAGGVADVGTMAAAAAGGGGGGMSEGGTAVGVGISPSGGPPKP